MLSVIILNSANGIYQNSMFGIIADFPPQYINASIMGMNFCGIFISVLLIITTLGKFFCKKFFIFSQFFQRQKFENRIFDFQKFPKIIFFIKIFLGANDVQWSAFYYFLIA